ncbi:MAG: patatin-like phospholipase family protein [Luteolibacter sp.]
MLDFLRRVFGRDSRPHRTERPLEKREAPKLGLALSSGGARGLAHVGVLQVLEENDIEVHAIAGSSMGAYVGALWAAGFSGKDLEKLAAEMQSRKKLWQLADPIVPPLRGLFHGLKGKAHLEKSLGDLRFEDLERQLLIVTVDIDTKERLVLRSGKISDAVHASCAMPGIIAPVLLDGRRCVDGGVVDPVPVGALRKYSNVDHVIAISVIPSFAEVDSGACARRRPIRPTIVHRTLSTLNGHLNLLAPGNAVDTFRQSIRAAQIRLAHDSVKRADLCLRPHHFSAAWHDYANFERFIEAGRQVATEHLDEIKALLKPSLLSYEIPGNQLVGKRVAG